MDAAAPSAVLRPRGIGELLDQAIRLYRKNFLKFIGIIALVQIPISLENLLVTISQQQVTRTALVDPSQTTRGAFYSTLLGTYGVLILTMFLVQGLGNAALTRAIADSFLGEPVTILGTYAKIGNKWLSLVWALFLLGLVGIVALIFWVIVPCLGWVAGLGIYIFLYGVVLPLLGPIVVLEGQRGSDAIKRAWDLGRSQFWRVIGFTSVLWIFNLLVVSGPVYLVTAILTPILTQAVPAGQSPLIVTALLTGVLGALLGILYYTLQSTAILMMYFDLRVRTEGLDMALSAYQSELQAQPAELSIEGQPEALQPKPATMVDLLWKAPQMPPRPTITWNDMGKFALFSLAIYGALALIYGVIFVVILGQMAATGQIPH